MTRISTVFLVISLLFAALTVAPQMALACSCAAGGTALEAFSEADAVFSGQVQSIEKAGMNVLVTFDTGVVWKGEANPSYEVMTTDNSAACGYPFVEDEWYIVYASVSDDGMLSTGLCSRTSTLALSEDLLTLGEGENPDGDVEFNESPAWLEWLDSISLYVAIFIGSYILTKYVYPKMEEKRKNKNEHA